MEPPQLHKATQTQTLEYIEYIQWFDQSLAIPGPRKCRPAISLEQRPLGRNRRNGRVAHGVTTGPFAHAPEGRVDVETGGSNERNMDGLSLYEAFYLSHGRMM